MSIAELTKTNEKSEEGRVLYGGRAWQIYQHAKGPIDIQLRGPNVYGDVNYITMASISEEDRFDSPEGNYSAQLNEDQSMFLTRTKMSFRAKFDSEDTKSYLEGIENGKINVFEHWDKIKHYGFLTSKFDVN